MDTNDISACERLVMKVIWDSTEDLALQDIMNRVNQENGKSWKPQTVSTFLSKLVRKDYLKLCRNGKIYTYKILVPEEAYRRKLYKHHISFWNHNDIVEFVQEMIGNQDLTKEDLEKLQ